LVDLHNLQNVLWNFEIVQLENLLPKLDHNLDANPTLNLVKWCTGLCKLCRLTNCKQHNDYSTSLSWLISGPKCFQKNSMRLF